MLAAITNRTSFSEAQNKKVVCLSYVRTQDPEVSFDSTLYPRDYVLSNLSGSHLKPCIRDLGRSGGD
jgi:hypothetical protein